MHKSVLKAEVMAEFVYLKNKSGYFVDGTLGAAGHSIELAKAFPEIKIIGVDKDGDALQLAQKLVAEEGLTGRFTFIQKDSTQIMEITAELGIDKICGALLDLGVSSMQLDQLGRGFTFGNTDAPLDMRMDQGQEIDARYILNNYPKERLEKILDEYGEERYYRQIAERITKRRTEKHFEIVGDLLQILEKAIPGKVIAMHKKHFATNTFRALRMEVNAEVIGLERSAKDFVDILEEGSKLAVITFHSIEDRIIKKAFKSLANPCVCPAEIPYCACGKEPQVTIVHKKPISPSSEETMDNPRARSAKLRVVEKL